MTWEWDQSHAGWPGNETSLMQDDLGMRLVLIHCTNQTISHTTMLQKGEMGHKLPSGHLHSVLWGAVHGCNSSRTLCRHETDDGQQHCADWKRRSAHVTWYPTQEAVAKKQEMLRSRQCQGLKQCTLYTRSLYVASTSLRRSPVGSLWYSGT